MYIRLTDLQARMLRATASPLYITRSKCYLCPKSMLYRSVTRHLAEHGLFDTTTFDRN